MDYIIASLLSYLLLYKYVALFIVIFLSGALLPLPMNTMLVAAGAFIGQRYFDPCLTFGVAEIANVLGDSVGYFVARKWKDSAFVQRFMKKYKYVKKVESFMQKHARLTIVATRFMGAPGTAVNYISGVAGVPVRMFLLCDIIGNALDIGLFLTIGYFLGSFWQEYSDISSLLSLIALVVLCIVILSLAMWRKRRMHHSVAAARKDE